MGREEKRRKFNAAIINMLYPPSPPPPSQSEDDDKPVNSTTEGFDVEYNPIPGSISDLGQSSSSTSDDNDGDEYGCLKLSRAQRKRLRRKKLKEDVLRRKHVIGPLLPLRSDVDEEGTPGVRRNAAVEVESAIDDPGDQSGCSNPNKLKNRRMAKRLAKERLKSSNEDLP